MLNYQRVIDRIISQLSKWYLSAAQWSDWSADADAQVMAAIITLWHALGSNGNGNVTHTVIFKCRLWLWHHLKNPQHLEGCQLSMIFWCLKIAKIDENRVSFPNGHILRGTMMMNRLTDGFRGTPSSNNPLSLHLALHLHPLKKTSRLRATAKDFLICITGQSPVGWTLLERRWLPMMLGKKTSLTVTLCTPSTFIGRDLAGHNGGISGQS